MLLLLKYIAPAVAIDPVQANKWAWIFFANGGGHVTVEEVLTDTVVTTY